MEKQIIARINGTEIFAETNEDGIFVPIKPICTALGIDYAAQYNKLQMDETLSSVIAIIATTGADGKQYDMVCLPLKFVYGWLFSINPGKVAPEAKETVLKYRNVCYNVLYDHFEGIRNKTIEAREVEIKLLEEKAQIEAGERAYKARKREIDQQLAELQKERLNPQPSLFD